jgi:O-antigen biosynthesis protein
MDESKVYCRDNAEVMLPATSLLICSRNRHQLLWGTIQSVLEGCEIPTEIVVIDQSDSPDSILLNFQPGCDCTFRYLWSEKKGVSLGRNMAILAAAYPILLFTDDDMLMTPTWFGSLVRALLAAGPKGAISGRVLASEEEGNEGFVPSTREDNHSIIYRGRINRDILFTNNMAIYRSAFETVGYFDTRLGPGTPYPAAEDNDLGFRLLEAGYQIIYEPRAVNYHRAWRSENEFSQLFWTYGFGQGAFYAKYFSLNDTYTIRRMAKDIMGNLVRFPFRILLNPSQAFRDMLFVVGILCGATRWCIATLGMR